MQGTSGLPRCGELHLRREEDFKGELEGPVENRAPVRGFERFVMKDYLQMWGWG